MRRNTLCLGLMMCGVVAAGSCAIDDRKVQVTLPLGADAGQPGSPGGPSPQLEVSPAAIDLGWVATGFPVRARVFVRNGGGAPLPEPAVSLAPGGDTEFEIIHNRCVGALAPRATCEVRVQLVASRVGQARAVLRVESEGSGAADVALGAEGLAPGELSLAPAAGSFEDFGKVTVGTTVQGVFRVSNPGAVPSGPLAFQSNRPEFIVLDPTDGAVDCVPGLTSLVSGARCDVRVAFTPGSRGLVEAVLTSRTDSAGAISLRLSGTGSAPPLLVASADQLDFEGVVLGSAGVRAVRFENRGDEPLTLGGAGLAPVGAEGFAILDSDCGADRVLAGGEACGLQLEYRPARSGEEMTAELWAEAAGGQQRQIVALRGVGLETGVLTVAPASAGEEDFGAVLLAAGSVIRTFRVTNPSAQPSGVLSVSASEGFEVVAPPEPGECGDAATSIVNGEACTVRVRFAPGRREPYRGAVTVSSALAGAASLGIAGRGVVPGALDLAAELDFGRVFTGASSRRTLSLTNGGDEPLTAPSLELTSGSAPLAAAFSYQSACSEPLGPGEACEIGVTFAPSQPVPHWGNLRLSSPPGGAASVLLLAEALAPGSLQVSPALGATPDFGDVQIGTSATREFTLLNPGEAASGRLTLRSDSNRFEVIEGSCGSLDATGLEPGGGSCGFAVRFTPDSSLELIANLAVQSPGAGQTGLELRGRGRAPAALLATGNRDLGRAIIGQESLTQPENQFVWTVTNRGDLPSGLLSVANDNPTEFEISDDTCQGARLPGGGTCEMTLRFRPSDVGARTGNIVVLDTESGSSAPLVLTGVGDRLAQLGQSCVNATCAAGTCTGGVCCDRACDGTCQVCSAEGVCSDQSGQEPCGNGEGRCFGVNSCLLPNAQACGQPSDCGTGNCEPRLNGLGASDRICCAQDCDALGLQCNAQGQCQAPTLAAGATCGGPADAPCGAGLECKTCLGGGNRCTPPDECCGGCAPGYTCLGGERCGCPAGQLDCGGGLCIQNRAGACCPATPECPAARPVCDAADNVCKECVNATQCAGANRTCNAGICGCSFGSRDCGGGRCIANSECCETCTGGRTCQNGTCGCPAGQTFVNGQCMLPQGAACQINGTPCTTGQCVDDVCCESTCDGVCTECQLGTGRCLAPPDDDACGSFSCATTEVCRVGVPINAASGNRCLAPGQCKTADDCTTQPAPPRTPCGAAQELPLFCSLDFTVACEIVPVCNAAGNCIAPAVECLGVTEAITPTNCCSLDFPESLDPVGFVSQCVEGASGNITAVCDGASDCPAGTDCCLSDAGNFNSIACSASCGLGFSTGVVVCGSPGEPNGSCQNGATCTDHPNLQGWRVCMP